MGGHTTKSTIGSGLFATKAPLITTTSSLLNRSGLMRPGGILGHIGNGFGSSNNAKISNTNVSGANGGVLTDIDNMFCDLNRQLDAMLESDKQVFGGSGTVGVQGGGAGMMNQSLNIAPQNYHYLKPSTSTSGGGG